MLQVPGLPGDGNNIPETSDGAARLLTPLATRGGGRQTYLMVGRWPQTQKAAERHAKTLKLPSGAFDCKTGKAGTSVTPMGHVYQGKQLAARQPLLFFPHVVGQ
jgi:hypothetical protein